MGKDLKGKELGHGICQRKNGRYDARFVDRFGKRQSISGKDLKDVKRRYNEALYENEKRVAFGLRPLPELEGKRYTSLNWIDANNANAYQVGNTGGANNATDTDSN